MGGTGLEHSGLKTIKTSISENPRTESGTVQDDSGQNDPRLAHLIKVWPDLQDTVKQQINELIHSSMEGTTD